MNDLVKIPFNNFGKCQKSWKCVGKCKKQMNEENSWEKFHGKIGGASHKCLFIVAFCTLFYFN